MVYYTFFIHVIQYGIPKLSLSGRVGGPRPVPSSVDPSEQNEPSGSSPSCPDCDWEDYNYDPRAAGGANGLRRDSLAASLANLLDGLPGLDADAIAAMIRNLPMPNDVEVPGLTVEEAIEV